MTWLGASAVVAMADIATDKGAEPGKGEFGGDGSYGFVNAGVAYPYCAMGSMYRFCDKLGWHDLPSMI